MLLPLTGNLSPLGLSKSSTAQTWQSVIESYAPLVWYRNNESSGSAINSGSLGSAVDGALSGTVVQGQVGQLGASEAYSTSLVGAVFMPYTVGWGDLTVFEWCFLVSFRAGFAVNQRVIGREVGYFCIRLAAGGIRVTMRNTAAGVFNTDSSTLVAQDDSWHLLNFSFDNSTDRTPHIYIDGTEVSYAATAAVTGTYQGMTSGGTLMNNHLNSAGLDGRIDEAVLTNFVWSTSQRSAAKIAAGL